MATQLAKIDYTDDTLNAFSPSVGSPALTRSFADVMTTKKREDVPKEISVCHFIETSR
jgi:hypothetical protein